MEALWQSAIGLTGIAGIGAFVLYALYKDWLQLPALADLTKPQRFSLFKLFLVLTFLFGVASLGLSAYRSHLEKQAAQASANELAHLLSERHQEGLRLIGEFRQDASPESRDRLDSFKTAYEAQVTAAKGAVAAGELVRYHELVKQMVSTVQEAEFITPVQKARFVRGACGG